ncbi:hypothetical protein [Campylobacter curvus]|uniref:hypothetical protein n=1 Tax=Campylobacter curvus TaxID=200 RepID=UPI000381D8F0|nr:hypothetical protein [Campylobacter curvus]QKF62135.1 putative membrane protein [Campylobacter curvus]UEB50422.1 hypothetical protein LK426_02920 [Campylobacter curvus]
MKIFLAVYYAFCAMLLGLSATLLASLSVWLEMRIHNRYIVVGALILGVIYSFFKKNAKISALFICEILLFLLAFLMDKQNLIYYNIKETYLDAFSFSQIKCAFLGLLLAFNCFALFKILPRRSK